MKGRTWTRRPALEELEGRELLAGNVTAALIGGDLLVLGDQADNALVIEAVAGGVQITGEDGTLVNGAASAQIPVAGGVDDLRVLLRGGSDRVVLRGLDVADDLSVVTGGFLFGQFPGEQGDAVTLEGVTVGDDLDILTEGGDDTVVVEGGTVGDDARINTRRGDDVVEVRNAVFQGRLTVHLGQGDDLATLAGLTVNGRAAVLGGSGEDGVALQAGNTFAQAVFLHGGKDGDSLAVDDPRPGFDPQVIDFEEERTTVRFTPDGIPPGTQTASFNGATISGGTARVLGVVPFYASIPFAYVVGDGNTAEVVFDRPVDSVRFFFVHGTGTNAGGVMFSFDPATATARDQAGNVVATASSAAATFPGDPGNFVTLAGGAPITRVVIEGGIVDDLSFVRG